MGKRIVSLLLSAVLAVSCLTGCAKKEITEETKPVPAKKEIVSVTEEAQADGKTLVIDTTVEVPDLSSLEEVTLCFDEDLLDTMVEELVHSQYPGLKEGTVDGYRDWSVATEEQLLFSLSLTDDGFEAGRIYYLDVLRDLNGQDMGEDEHHNSTPYYMTEHIPDKLNMPAAEAAETLGTFLGQYSCFDYKPWNVVAVNCRNVPGSSGYYQAKMQPQYDGLPVLIDGVPYVSTCLSAEGVFTFQGVMVLKEQSRKPADATMPLEEAVEQFKADSAEDPQGDQVTVDRITAGYLAQSHYSGTWTLSPVWVFEYSAVGPTADNRVATTYYTYAYRMDSRDLYSDVSGFDIS